MGDRLKLAALAPAMLLVLVASVAWTLKSLYDAAFAQQERRLVESVATQAGLIESITRLLRQQDRAVSDSELLVRLRTLLLESAPPYENSALMDLVLLRRQDSSVEILLPRETAKASAPLFIDASAPCVEAAGLALSGHRGTTIGRDWRGVPVLAVYRPLSQLGLGVVGKIPLVEMRAPYLRAGAAAALFGTVLAALWLVVFRNVGMDYLLRHQDIENKYKVLFDTSVEGVAVLSEGVFEDCNQKLCELWGCKLDDIVGASVLDFSPGQQVRGEDSATLWEELSGAAAEAPRFRWRFRRKDGSLFDARVSLRSLELRGKATIIVSIRDISSQLLREDWVEQLSRAVEHSPASVVITDTAGNIEYVNPEFEKITGYTRGEVLGRNPRFLKSGLTDPKVYSDLWAALTSGREWHGEFLNRKKNGELYWESASLSPVFDHDGNISHFVGVNIDISERKEQERQLLRRAHQQAAVAELGQFALSGAEPGELISMVVAEAATGLEVPFAEFWERVSERDGNGGGGSLGHLILRGAWGWDSASVGRDTIEGGRGSQAGFALLGGSAVVVDDLASEHRFRPSPLLLERGIVSGVNVVVHGKDEALGVLSAHSSTKQMFDSQDVSFLEALAAVLASAIARKRAETQLAELNTGLEARIEERTQELQTAIKELDSFTSAVSHDLRQPLHNVNGFISLLAHDLRGQLDGRSVDYMARAQAGIAQMNQMITDLLQLSRVGKADLHRRPVDLGALAEEIADELREKDPGRDVGFSIASGLETDGDEGLLRVLLQNLIGNAWKFSSKCDKACIEVGMERAEAGATVYFVSDNGSGFSMNYADKLFKPFQRLHSAEEFEGSGVGLATAARVVARHGGRIWCDAEPGEGATFFFTLGP